MTDLERQCEEIRNNPCWIPENVQTLLAYIAELRRPWDAKEIAQIQERNNKGYCAVPNVEAQLLRDVQSLLHALAESQRLLKSGSGLSFEQAKEMQGLRADNSRLISLLKDERQRGNGAYADWQQEYARLDAEIARLQSPPEERGDIASRQLEIKAHIGQAHLTFPPGSVIGDIDTLLQDCARHRNAHAVNMARADAAEQLAAHFKSDLQTQITQRLESGQKFADCLLRADAAEKRVAVLTEALQFYADPKTYSGWWEKQPDGRICAVVPTEEDNGGDKARTALASPLPAEQRPFNAEEAVGYAKFIDSQFPLAQTQAEQKPQHVCGLQGYNGMIDPPCPGCES